MPRIVIIGAGYAGIAAATALESIAQVIVIEPKPYFFHNVGAVRACVDASFINKCIVPLDKLFKKPAQNKVVQARVAAVHKDKVVLEKAPESTEGLSDILSTNDNEISITFDYLLIATGSTYNAPFKSDFNSAQEVTQNLEKVAARIKESQKILLIGGGPVAVETAGEIRHMYADKEISIVTSSAELVPGPFNPKVRAKLNPIIAAANINVKYNTKTTSIPATLDEQLSKQRVELSDGTSMDVDMALVCIGATPGSSRLHFELGDNASVKNERHLIKVTGTMQVEGFENIFAAGDSTTADEYKVSFLGDLQAKVAAKNIAKLIAKNNKPLEVYKAPGSQRAIFITFGPKLGAGLFPFGNFAAGSTLVPMIKGKDMFAGRFWATAGYPKMP